MNDVEKAILLYLYFNDKATTTQLAKLFCQNNKDIRNWDRKVRYYLNKFIKEGLVVVEEKNGKKIFKINRTNVHVGVGELKIQAFDGSEVTITLGKVLIAVAKDGFYLEPVQGLTVE